ncbi:MotE family protein [Starkeya koreensis]|uniref:MotE family protein n=1 Tax=Ancylobacter koreensis TaxID=266121 RepID=A0ABT0DL59_9HYPH|nr:MotE family protein [Ancylobacter koreensis]MCK0207904.1 MotE family protein [Ancylobacter koreensis]
MTTMLVLTHICAVATGGVLGLLSAGLCLAARIDAQPAPVAVPAKHRPGRPGWSERAVDLAILVALTLGATSLGALSLHAETAPAAAETASPAAAITATRPAPPAPTGDNADQYCQGIVDQVRDARFARQKAALDAMGQEIEARIARLEAKRAEYEQWLARREEFLRKADDAVIAVFSQMRPDAASAQLTIMGDDPAAAILAKLNPRVASAILNEMDPARAARLTGVMVGIAKRPQPDGKSS